jgi:hypothetical protein
MKNRLSPSPGRIFYLDIARALAIISITLNHAVNRSYRNYHGQMANRSHRCCNGRELSDLLRISILGLFQTGRISGGLRLPTDASGHLFPF